MHAEIILLIYVIAALSMYAVFGGADFGAGVWEFNLRLRADADEKKLLYQAIGPVWEANHVWLIFLLMLMWNGFPSAFAAICRIAWLPLLLGLAGIVFRGAAYAFRSSLAGLPQQQRHWERVFAVASTAAPFFLGCALGTIACDRSTIDAQGRFSGNPFTDWFNVGSVFFGFYAVGICSFLASVFFVREASHRGLASLENRWRTRAVWMASLLGIFAMVGLATTAVWMTQVWSGLVDRAWPIVLVSIIAGSSTIALLLLRRYQLAAMAAALSVVAVIFGWAIGQYPYLVVPHLTIEQSMAPRHVIQIINVTVALGLLLVIPPLIWLFYIFKSQSQVRTKS